MLCGCEWCGGGVWYVVCGMRYGGGLYGDGEQGCVGGELFYGDVQGCGVCVWSCDDVQGCGDGG